MNLTRQFCKAVESALAFAHAAADRPTAPSIWKAKSYAADVLERLPKLPLGSEREAGRLMTLVGELRAMLRVLDRTLDRRLPVLVN